MASTTRHFDILDFVKKSKEYGTSKELAKFQARQIEQAIDIAVAQAKEDINSKELATKRNIKELDHFMGGWIICR